MIKCNRPEISIVFAYFKMANSQVYQFGEKYNYYNKKILIFFNKNAVIKNKKNVITTDTIKLITKPNFSRVISYYFP